MTRYSALRQHLPLGAAVVVAAALVTGGVASADGDDSGNRSITVQLDGYQETLTALSTTGVGTFSMKVDRAAQEISYTLSYDALEGSVAQAHIHFGSAAQTGGISTFLCTNLGNGPAGTQLCPAAPATITGTLRPADVIGPVGQGILAGEFEELVAAIKAEATYVNVHTTKYPGGEIRSQLVNNR
jgi:CHRD domain